MNRIFSFLAVAFLAASALAVPVREDFSNPRKCVQTFLSVLAEGELEQIEHCFAAPAAGEAQNVSFSSNDVYFFFIERALAQKFGAQNVPAPFNTRGLARTLREKIMRTGSASIAGDAGVESAVFATPDGRFRFAMSKVAGQWKLDRGQQPLLDPAPLGQAMRNWCDQAMKDIRAGKWATAAEAAKGIEEAMQQARAAVASGASATTQPSQGPAQ